MKTLKLYIVLISPLFFAACSGAPLDSGTPPAGKLFAQVSLEGLQGPDFLTEEGYEIHLEKEAFVMGNLFFLETGGASALKFHEGQEHSEPSSCDFEGSIPRFFYLDFLGDPDLPCVTLAEGSYAGLRFEIRPGVEGKTEGLPPGETASLIVEGTATREGVIYPFAIRGNLESPVEILKALSLSGESHHVALGVDPASWFHGLDFALLEQEEGVVKIDEGRNAEFFKALCGRIVQSFSL